MSEAARSSDASPVGWSPKPARSSASPAGWSPKSPIFKRAAAGGSLSSLQTSYVRSNRTAAKSMLHSSLTGRSLTGRKISVPYSLIIDDDESGCTCDSRVLEEGTGGYLVVLAGEKLWKPASFVQQWLCSEEQASGSRATTPVTPDASELNAQFSAALCLSPDVPPSKTSTTSSTGPPWDGSSETLSRNPTVLQSLDSAEGVLLGGSDQDLMYS